MNHAPENHGRLKFLTVFIFAALGLYTIKLFSLQIVNGESYQTMSRNISQRTRRIPALRGEIYDRNANSPLILNIDAFAVTITPGEIPADRLQNVMDKTAELLEMTPSEVSAKIPPELRRAFRQIELKSSVPYENICAIAENTDELPGVSWYSKPIRNYIETRSFSHILGYVGDITSEELKIYYNEGYTGSSTIGKTGIEKQYESVLRGKDGFEYRVVDVRGRSVQNNRMLQPPEPGKNIVLTIDRRIQTLAEQALGERIGAAVVLQAATGEVLAMASYPYFDPNLFVANQAGEYSRLLNDPTTPLLNRAVDASYPPASTFKILMSTALMEEKAIPRDKEIDCPGHIEYGDRIFRCHIRGRGHGPIAMQDALAQSCDIYYWVACRDYLGIERIVSYAHEFGFGSPAEIDLPSQASGFVPTPQWKQRRYHEKWLGGDTMNMSIGQGFTLVSPLQLANAVAMVINDGTIYRPHLLKEIRNPADNQVEHIAAPEILRTSNISPETFAQVREDMRYVITDGTVALVMRNRAVQIAAKTGTAEVGYQDRWHSWLAAYGPYDAPAEEAVVVAVIVEAENTWEWWAPYATNIIFQGIFANQDYEEAVDALGYRYLMNRPRGRQE